MIINDKLWERCILFAVKLKTNSPTYTWFFKVTVCAVLRAFPNVQWPKILESKGYFEEEGNHTLQYVFALNLWSNYYESCQWFFCMWRLPFIRNLRSEVRLWELWPNALLISGLGWWFWILEVLVAMIGFSTKQILGESVKFSWWVSSFCRSSLVEICANKSQDPVC